MSNANDDLPKLSSKQNLKRERVYRVFERISTNYDAANLRISLGMQTLWKRHMVGEILSCARPADRFLDVCCGTGDISLALARSRPDCEVVGIDFSPAMLKVARKRANQFKNVSLVEGDAAKLPFADGTFRAAAISFGLRNTVDYRKVLSEMKRALQTGGALFCLDSFVPDAAIIKPFYKLYFHGLMPLLGGGNKYREEYRWLWQSTDEFLTKDGLTNLLKDIGMQSVACKSHLFGVCALHTAQKI